MPCQAPIVTTLKEFETEIQELNEVHAAQIKKLRAQTFTLKEHEVRLCELSEAHRARIERLERRSFVTQEEHGARKLELREMYAARKRDCRRGSRNWRTKTTGLGARLIKFWAIYRPWLVSRVRKCIKALYTADLLAPKSVACLPTCVESTRLYVIDREHPPSHWRQYALSLDHTSNEHLSALSSTGRQLKWLNTS